VGEPTFIAMKRVVSRAGHEFVGIARGRTGPHRDLRDRILLVAFATVIAAMIGSALIYWFEHGATGSEIATVGDSIFWTTTQLLTVSSQMRVPTSTGGRIVDVFLELYAITVVTTLAGSWGAFFHHQTRQRWGDPVRSS
jgi:hypothetical protein